MGWGVGFEESLTVTVILVFTWTFLLFLPFSFRKCLVWRITLTLDNNFAWELFLNEKCKWWLLLFCLVDGELLGEMEVLGLKEWIKFSLLLILEENVNKFIKKTIVRTQVFYFIFLVKPRNEKLKQFSRKMFSSIFSH